MIMCDRCDSSPAEQYAIYIGRQGDDMPQSAWHIDLCADCLHSVTLGMWAALPSRAQEIQLIHSTSSMENSNGKHDC